jgi:hypothetical protein
MGEFFGSFGALILGFLAFAQFWIKILWEKYLRKGKIDYYKTGTIAIGYDHLGPTIYLIGTIRALDKDVFIRTIDLLVIREKDKAQHVFEWAAFLSPIIDVSGSLPAPQEIPSGFMISPNSPHRFYIIFRDSNLFKDMRSSLNEYYSEWYKTTEELSKIWLSLTGVPPQPAILAQQSAVIDRFRKSKIHVDTFTALDRKCYWEAGDYQLTINIRASKPDVTFTRRYRFSISEVDSKNLKLNVISILKQPVSRYLRVPDPPYNFAFSEYRTE